MSVQPVPVTDVELRHALAAPARLTVPFDLRDAIAAEIRSTRQRRRPILGWAPAWPVYPDQRPRWGLALVVVLLAIALLVVGALLAGRLLRAPIPHGNGVIDVPAYGGMIEVHPDGSSAVALELGLEATNPVWSPTGEWLAVWVHEGRTWRIRLHSADDQLITIDIQHDAGLDRPATPSTWTISWSADGASLAFDAAVGGFDHIYRYDLGDRRLRDVTPPGFGARDPAWSPDGRRIAFIPFDQSRWGSQPWTMAADGTDARPLGPPLPDGFHAGSGWAPPVWSPDGRQLAFDAQQMGDFRLFVVNADGSGLIRLAPGIGQPYAPAWSPDSRRILFADFVGTAEDSDDAYVVGREGAGLRLLARDADPATWTPDGSAVLVASPSCSSDVRSAQACDQSLWLIDTTTGARRELVTADRLARSAGVKQGPGIGIGVVAERPVAP